MTRCKNVEAVEQNWRIKEGIKCIKSGSYKSYTEAANDLNVLWATKTHCAAGWKTPVEVHEDEQILTAEEETELQYLSYECNYPPFYSLKAVFVTFTTSSNYFQII